jgi:hypothetical protein
MGPAKKAQRIPPGETDNKIIGSGAAGQLQLHRECGGHGISGKKPGRQHEKKPSQDGEPQAIKPSRHV